MGGLKALGLGVLNLGFMAFMFSLLLAQEADVLEQLASHRVLEGGKISAWVMFGCRDRNIYGVACRGPFSKMVFWSSSSRGIRGVEWPRLVDAVFGRAAVLWSQPRVIQFDRQAGLLLELHPQKPQNQEQAVIQLHSLVHSKQTSPPLC